MLILLAISAFFLALLFGLTGMGGGVAYTPLQLLFGIPFQTAATTSLFLIFLTGMSASSFHIRQKRIPWLMVLCLELFTASGSFFGGYFSYLFPEIVLKTLFSLFLIASGIVVLLGKKEAKPKSRNDRWYTITVKDGDKRLSVNMLVAAPASVCAGFFAGLLGVGGGLFKLPLMISLLGIPVRIAVASSALMVSITGISGFAGRALTFGFDWKTALVLGGVIFIGANIGARYATKIDQNSLKRVIGIALIVIGLFFAVAQLLHRFL